MKCIKGAKIILKDAVVADKALLFNERIIGVIDPREIPADVEVIEAEGCFVAPGLVDVHIHGYLGEDASDGIADGISSILGGNGLCLIFTCTPMSPLMQKELREEWRKRLLLWNCPTSCAP